MTMTRHQIIQAWRDADFYDGLDSRQRIRVPQSPVGLPTLADDDLLIASGGAVRGEHSRGLLFIGQ